MMKKLYIKPIIQVVATAPAQLCAASPNTWHVDHDKDTLEAKAVTPTMARLSTMMAQYRAITPLMKVTGDACVALSCCKTMF